MTTGHLTNEPESARLLDKIIQNSNQAGKLKDCRGGPAPFIETGSI